MGNARPEMTTSLTAAAQYLQTSGDYQQYSPENETIAPAWALGCFPRTTGRSFGHVNIPEARYRSPAPIELRRLAKSSKQIISVIQCSQLIYVRMWLA